jgi:hypothetical protein
VCDTYNNKIKIVDPAQRSAKTLTGTGKPGTSDEPAQFNEPTGLSSASGKLYVADTNNHLIRTIDLADGNRVATLTIKGLTPPAAERTASKPDFSGAAQVKVSPATVKPADGKIQLAVGLKLPKGYKINPLAPLRYYIESADGKSGGDGPIAAEALDKLVSVKDKAAAFTIELPAPRASGSQTLRVGLAFYYCQEGAEGLCKAGGVVWTVPVTVSTDATTSSIPLAHEID